MGHADIQTTMRFLHYAPHEQDAQWWWRRVGWMISRRGGPESQAALLAHGALA